MYVFQPREVFKVNDFVFVIMMDEDVIPTLLSFWLLVSVVKESSYVVFIKILWSIFTTEVTHAGKKSAFWLLALVYSVVEIGHKKFMSVKETHGFLGHLNSKML